MSALMSVIIMESKRYKSTLIVFCLIIFHRGPSKLGLIFSGLICFGHGFLGDNLLVKGPIYL